MLYKKAFPRKKFKQRWENCVRSKGGKSSAANTGVVPSSTTLPITPGAIQLTIAAIAARYPNQELNVVFDPASATAHSGVFQEELGKSFRGADRVLIVQSQRPTTVKNFGNIDWNLLCQAIAHDGRELVVIAEQLSEIVQFITEHADGGGVFLVLSNSTCLDCGSRTLFENWHKIAWPLSLAISAYADPIIDWQGKDYHVIEGYLKIQRQYSQKLCQKGEHTYERLHHKFLGKGFFVPHLNYMELDREAITQNLSIIKDKLQWIEREKVKLGKKKNFRAEKKKYRELKQHFEQLVDLKTQEKSFPGD